MAYEKTNWVDNETPINAANLNKMEDGIVEASKTGGVSEGAVVGWTKEEIPEGYEEIILPSDVPIGMIANVEKDANIPEGYEAAIGKSIIQVGYNGSTAFKVTATDTKTFVPMAKTILSKGNGFEVLSDGSIKVKKKMYAKAKAQTMLTTSGSGDKVLMIDLNQYDWSYDRAYSLKDYVNLKTDTYIIDLKENDILKLYYQGDAGDTFHTSSAFVFMTVEEVDDPNKLIKKVAVTPVKPISGSIVDGTNIDDKATNTYSANTIDGLVKISKLENITDFITPKAGYNITGNVFKDRNRYFGSLTVEKTGGATFTNSDEQVATFNKRILHTVNGGCFLGDSVWQTNNVGYCFMSETTIIISDRNNKGYYKFAKFNFDVVTS